MNFILLIVIISLFIGFVFKLPSIKGKLGEKQISFILDSLPANKYITFNDVLIYTPYGSSQIDHVVISLYGIFVIETKNYSGWIYGGVNSEKWIKNVYGKKYEFQNPIKQNFGHIKALQNKLNLHNNNVYKSIIAFSNSADLKFEYESNVLYFSEVKRYIKSFQNQILTEEQIEELALKMNDSIEYSKEEKKEHIREVRVNMKIREKKIAEGVCPYCDGNLVLRKGKYGSFYGCSNYPRCHFTKNK